MTVDCITIFRIIAVLLNVRIVNVFVFHAIYLSCNLISLTHLGTALIFGQEGHRPPCSKVAVHLCA